MLVKIGLFWATKNNVSTAGPKDNNSLNYLCPLVCFQYSEVFKFIFINLSVVDTDTYVYLYVSILGSQNVVLK